LAGLLKRANAPLAVLWKPAVLLKSVPTPVAVFSVCGVAKDRPRLALASAWRDEPASLSLVLVSAMSAGGVRIATAQNSATAIAAGLIWDVILAFIQYSGSGWSYLFLQKASFSFSCRCRMIMFPIYKRIHETMLHEIVMAGWRMPQEPVEILSHNAFVTSAYEKQ
jgi:hypothetical protein